MNNKKLRDKIAIAAMAAIINKAPLCEDVEGEESAIERVDAIAAGAYFYADAMLKARQQ